MQERASSPRRFRIDTTQGIDNIKAKIPEPVLEPEESNTTPHSPLGLMPSSTQLANDNHNSEKNSQQPQKFKATTQADLVVTSVGLAYETDAKRNALTTMNTSTVNPTGSSALNTAPTNAHSRDGSDALNNTLQDDEIEGDAPGVIDNRNINNDSSSRSSSTPPIPPSKHDIFRPTDSDSTTMPSASYLKGLAIVMNKLKGKLGS